MIGIEGQYLFRFDISNNTDFLDTEDLVDFTLIEEAGNLLPTFEFVFLTGAEILTKLNEGNSIGISMGAGKRDMIDSKLIPTSRTIKKQGTSRYLVRLAGLYDALGYVLDCKMRAFNSSGVSAISSIANSYFSLDFNIESSNDSQIWIQHNVPSKKFVNNIWMHSNLIPSFPSIGITSDGKFVLKDIISLLKNDPSWYFVPSVTGQDLEEIEYMSDFVIEADTGFLNQWVGYERTKIIQDIEEDISVSISPTLNTMLAVGGLERLKDIGTRVAETALLSDNVHSKYWEVYLHNLTHLAVFSAFKLFLSYYGVFKPTQILDLVYFVDKDIGGTEASILSHSGRYIISKVSRSLTNKTFVTTCELNRESSVLAE
jgi:hypothetical protein